jgi:Right handed beta helix region
MAKDPRFGHRLCVVVGTLLIALIVGAGELRAQALTCRTSVGLPVVPFLGLVTSNPISCTVNCAAGGTIASAVAMKPQTTNTLTITINGTCVESVDDVPSGVTLQAGTSGATLQAPSSSADPVLGISGIGVDLDNLTITGGVNALRGHSGAAFTGTNLVIEGASNADVLLNHAVVTLNTSTIQNSAGAGIQAYWGSTVFLNGGTVQQNAGIGVDARYDGSADVFGGAVLQNNGFYGAYAENGGAVEISDGTVTGNKVDGIGAGTGGHVYVTGSTTSVTSNAGAGIYALTGGSALIEVGATIGNNAGSGLALYGGATAKVRAGAILQGNGGDGIYVDSGTVTVGDAGAATSEAGRAIIQGNKLDGIFLRTNSVAIFNNSGNQIINNSGWGILCTGSPSNPLIYEEAGTVGTVSGNGAGQIACNVSP